MQIDDGFYRGVVIDNDDEYRRGRVQVRIEGLHDGFEQDNIKWAEVIQPAFMGILGGTGACSVLRIGTGVWIKFDRDYDHPIVVGVLVGGTEEHNELYDTPLPIENRKGADWGTEAIPKNCNFRYGTLLQSKKHINTVHANKYLTTITMETPGGHLIELDDTDNTSAIRITHSSGLSQITLNEDGSICIVGHTVNVTSAEKMSFESHGDISIEAKKNIYIKSGENSAIETGGGLKLASDKECLLQTKNNVCVQSDDGDVTVNAVNGCMVQTSKDTITMESKNKIVMTGEKETKLQGGEGSVTMNKSTSLSSLGGSVNIYGNKCNVDTKLDVFGDLQATGMLSGMFMLAKDFIPSIFPSVSTSRLVESYNSEFGEKASDINNEIQKARDTDDLDKKISIINNINTKIKNFNDDWNEKKEIIKKTMLNDFISQHIDNFGGIDPDDIQFLNESVSRSLGGIGGSGLKLTNRTPDGSKKLVEKNKCTCDWTDPRSWFEIDGIDEFNAERFKNILNYDVTWPDLQSLFPPTPQFSLLAVVKIVMKIVAKKVIKLLSAFRKMIMRYIQPVIDAINNAIAIINSIPPKLDFNLDLASMLGNPLFEFPQLPDTSMPNICCTVNECTCGDCASAVSQWQKAAEAWAEENISNEPLLPDTSQSDFVKSLPSGGRKQGSLI